MRKKIAVVISVLLVVALLAGCGASPSSSQPVSSPAPASSAAASSRPVSSQASSAASRPVDAKGNTFTVTVVNMALYDDDDRGAAHMQTYMENIWIVPAGTADLGPFGTPESPGTYLEGPWGYGDTAYITVDAYDGDAYDVYFYFADIEVTTATIEGVVLQPGAQVTITVDFSAETSMAQVVYQDGSKEEFTGQSYHSNGPNG